ncbi:hypothetical protein [Vulcanisaeta souniana]|uniref:hypothetical protein n=1 Tax=Vulcanisaeta souniana TaxID=164452 RepID=UPI001FB55558|nr:hypothetical protein [Vulcanisaeta souniana]
MHSRPPHRPKPPTREATAWTGELSPLMARPVKVTSLRSGTIHGFCGLFVVFALCVFLGQPYEASTCFKSLATWLGFSLAS